MSNLKMSVDLSERIVSLIQKIYSSIRTYNPNLFELQKYSTVHLSRIIFAQKIHSSPIFSNFDESNGSFLRLFENSHYIFVTVKEKIFLVTFNSSLGVLVVVKLILEEVD